MKVPIAERNLQDAILELCRVLGHLVYHTHDSRRSAKGFPDLVIVLKRGNMSEREHHARGVLFRELKGERLNGKVGFTTPAQDVWILHLMEAGADVGIWTPDDWRSGRIGNELGISKQNAG